MNVCCCVNWGIGFSPFALVFGKEPVLRALDNKTVTLDIPEVVLYSLRPL